MNKINEVISVLEIFSGFNRCRDLFNCNRSLSFTIFVMMATVAAMAVMMMFVLMLY